MTPKPYPPLPPEDLIYRVTGEKEAEWFVQSGKDSVRDIESALASVGRTLTSHKRILDFGCGCGRILFPMSEVVPPSSITGVDIDAEAIAWLGPRTRAAVAAVSELPPTPFGAASFDLVYCHSVFTHLNEDYQDRWLDELRRVTSPGAALVVSFSGAKSVVRFQQGWRDAGADPDPMIRELETQGILFVENDQWVNGPFPPFYHTTFHTLHYIQEHWGKFFRILNHIPSGSLDFQDFIVMERTPDSEPVLVNLPPMVVLPLPPPEMRRLVGVTEPFFFDNPGRKYVFPEIPPHLYSSVFDFGSGCGRQARQLMQQKTPPSRYLGIDINREMVEWCRENLTPANPAFQFEHHDVYSPSLGPTNSRRLTAPFPAGDGEFTMVNAHSVFTHIFQHQTEFYLREIARVLTADGIARTTWFFFSRRAFPWLENWQNTLFVNTEDPTNAVVYDLDWFRGAVREAGLAVRQTVFPGVPGHQWQIFLQKSTGESIDQFPTPEEAEGWICGSVPDTQPAPTSLAGQSAPVSPAIPPAPASPAVPPAPDALADQAVADALLLVAELRQHLSAAENEVRALRHSWSWKLTGPLRKVGRLFWG